MATITKLEELLVWQKCRELHGVVCSHALRPPFSKDFEHRDQILAASGSAMDLIAEGFGRGGNREFIHFLSMANGSLTEVKSQLYRAHDKKFIDDESFEAAMKLCNHSINLCGKLMLHLRSSKFKGQKFS